MNECMNECQLLYFSLQVEFTVESKRLEFHPEQLTFRSQKPPAAYM